MARTTATCTASCSGCPPRRSRPSPKRASSERVALRLQLTRDESISRARSVCGPGLPTPSCSLPSKTVSSYPPPAARYVEANFSCTASSTLSSSGALHDQQWRQGDRLAALEDLLRIAFVDRFARVK